MVLRLARFPPTHHLKGILIHKYLAIEQYLHNRPIKVLESVVIGVAGAGQENSTRPFQLVTGRVWRGSAFGDVKGRSELPEYVERYMRGEFQLNDFITHTMGLSEINTAFELMHEGKSIRTVIHF